MSTSLRFLRAGIIYSSAFFISLFGVLPLVWVVVTSLKTREKVYSLPIEWLPNPLTFEHYISVLNNAAMMRYFLNTAIIASLATAVALVVGVLAAYGFSRYKFPGSKTLLVSILFTKIFPRVTVIVPFYIMLRDLRLLNTHLGLALVYLIIVLPVSIWLLKGFFDNIPYEIEEAAIVDGCSPLGLLTRIVIPISTPAIAAVGMYAFILAWNEFLFALIYTSGTSARPISVGLAFFIDEAGIHWGPLMAASVLMSIPAIIVFSLAQRQLVQGLSEGAVKG